jgi:hypothetical protein
VDLANTSNPADSAARLEAALERIAALAGKLSALREPGPVPDTAVDTAAVAQRLDALIATLREALARPPA